MIAPWTRRRLRRLLPQSDVDATWLAVARELTGGWWLITDTSLVLVPKGQPAMSLALDAIRRVEVSPEVRALSVRLNSDRGVLIGTFAKANDVTRWLQEHHPG